jgi:hypothetical protein
VFLLFCCSSVAGVVSLNECSRALIRKCRKLGFFCDVLLWLIDVSLVTESSKGMKCLVCNLLYCVVMTSAICDVAAAKRVVNSMADDSIVSRNGRSKVGVAQSKLILGRPTSQSKPGLSCISLA